MTFGVTPTGFEIKRLEDVLSEIEAAEKAAFGAGINVGSDSVFGQLNGIVSERLAELWEVAEAVYGSAFPDTASGAALDAVASLTGTTRLAPAKSTGIVTAFGDDLTVIPAGSVVSVVGTNPTVKFVTTAEATIGDTVPGEVDIPVESLDFGPIPAASGTLTVIETPISGWDTVTNALDADLGRNLESDAALRLRREQELRAIGASTVEAIRARLLQVDGVTDAFVFENETSVTDPFGLPPKSFEAVVLGGTDADIRAAIFATKPTGIETFGIVSGVVVDSQGFSHTIEFSRPTTIPADGLGIFVEVDVFTDGNYPPDGDAQVRAAIVAFGDLLNVGADVILSKFYCPINEVSGIVDVTRLEMGETAVVADANITIEPREISTWDTSRIIVTSS